MSSCMYQDSGHVNKRFGIDNKTKCHVKQDAVLIGSDCIDSDLML